MRILYFVPRYWPGVGGAQLVSRELIKRMSARHEVAVVTQFTSDRDSFVRSVSSARLGEYQDGDIRIQRVGPSGLWRPLLRILSDCYDSPRVVNPLFAFLLDRAIAPHLSGVVEEFKPDVLHAVHIGLIYSSETARSVANRHRIPFVWTPFPHIEGATGWRGPRFRRLYQTSDAVVAMTKREMEWLIRQGAPVERVHVAPVGPLLSSRFDAEEFRRAHNLGPAPMVLFLGQKLRYKGYMQMAQAAPLVWEKVPDARFVFIGPRTTESESFFSNANININDARIIELPAVDDFGKASAYAACDVFCMPSTQESLGVVYLEAWTFRKPVIAANIHIAQEVIGHGKDGLLVEQDPRSIAEAITSLLQDAAQRARLGESGYVKVRTEYSWERKVDIMERLYSELASSEAR